MGCIPLVPERLAYPEVLPQAFHEACLYQNYEDLVSKLQNLLLNWPACLIHFDDLAASMDRYAWETQIGIYDDELERLAMD
jgi:hypothetical protein